MFQKDITVLAKKRSREFPTDQRAGAAGRRNRLMTECRDRIKHFAEMTRIKMKTMGKESVMINRDTIDLRYLEQIAG